ncbi:MAG: TauD/TfdA family dioxygenase, partial [Pseudomonadota bacterium]
MALNITPSGQACGATVTGLDLTKPLDPSTVDAIRAAWLEHHVLAFTGQSMDDDDLERFTLYFGPFGDDPYIAPIPGRSNVIAVKREADEKASVFAVSWHTDWSFQETPPAGTCLMAITVPPVGGDTLFVNQHKSLKAMPAELRDRIEDKIAIHSARGPYSTKGFYGQEDKEASGRSMDIRPSIEAE